MNSLEVVETTKKNLESAPSRVTSNRTIKLSRVVSLMEQIEQILQCCKWVQPSTLDTTI